MFILDVANKKFKCAKCKDTFPVRSSVAFKKTHSNCTFDSLPKKSLKYCVFCAEDLMHGDIKVIHYKREVLDLFAKGYRTNEVVSTLEKEGISLKYNAVQHFKHKHGFVHKQKFKHYHAEVLKLAKEGLTVPEIVKEMSGIESVNYPNIHALVKKHGVFNKEEV